MAGTKEEIIYLAKLAEQSERYDEMIEYVNQFTKMDGELTVEERNILSVAYKNVVGSRRASLRVMNSIEQKETKKGNSENVERIKKYKKEIESELKAKCSDILKLLDEYLIPRGKGEETQIFYLKMMGDYYRYLAEFASGDELARVSTKADESYKAAYDLATTKMPTTKPIRLGLALNYSVFYYEIMKQSEKACDMAKKAFDSAITDLDNAQENESYKDSTLIMQLLRDNLTLWTSDGADEEAK